MLQDYEIKRTETNTRKIMIVLEFALILIIMQSILTLFAGASAEEAVQFRLLAHSNAATDQLTKEEIRREIAPLIDNVVTTSTSKEEIGERLASLEPTLLKIASTIAKGQSIQLERKNALIPPKRSGFSIQPQATYDTYVLTIGSGRGDNWWCSLFPNVCFQGQEEKSEEKVTFFIWEWIKGLFS